MGCNIFEVESDERIRLDDLKASREDTVLVSVMYANNEIGVIQPIAEIGAIVAEARKSKQAPKAVFHCDAVQALGRVTVDVKASQIDMLVFLVTKCMVQKRIVLSMFAVDVLKLFGSLIDGGGHERGMRSGTLPVHQIVGLGKAAELAKKDLDGGHIEKVRELRDYMEADQLDDGFSSMVP